MVVVVIMVVVVVVLVPLVAVGVALVFARSASPLPFALVPTNLPRRQRKTTPHRAVELTRMATPRRKKSCRYARWW